MLKVIRNYVIVIVFVCLIIWKCGLTDDIDTIYRNSQKTSNENSIVLKYEKTTVNRIIDGDTFVIDGGDKVRLIGVDTPESVNPDKSKNTVDGIIASNYTKSILKKGQTVYLISDKSDKDCYGRLLRYVYLEKPNNINDLDIMLNAILIKKGYAKVMTVKPNTMLANKFNKLAKNISSSEN